MVFCRECGAKAHDDALFCGSCGKTLTTLSREQTGFSQPLAPISHDSQDDKEEPDSLPPLMPTSGVPATGDVPVVQGTPQVGSVPSVPASVTGLPVKAGMSAFVKVLIVAASCAVIVAGSVKVIPILVKGGNNTQSGASQSGTHPILTTVPMPPTQTSCPPAGTGRAAVIRPLVLGKHQNLIYTTREGSLGNPTSGTFKRYDITTGQITTIVNLDTSVADAQVSTDGQWLLFATAASSKHPQAAIQMIRMDGQGLQTLYCAPPQLDPTNFNSLPIGSIAWSSDQKLALFSEVDTPNSSSTPSPLYLLNIANGTIQKELESNPGSSTGYFPGGWIDKTHIALSSADLTGNSNGQSIYVLATKNGANQQSNNLQLIENGVCASFDLSPDHTHFFFTSCKTPNSISTMPVTGGSAHIIFTAQNEVDLIQVISTGRLLVYIGLHSTGSSQSGLYSMHLDGTGMTRVFGNNVLGNGPRLPFFGLDTSRDGNMYSLATAGCGNACHFTLSFGSLSGGSLTTIADGGNGTGFDGGMIGWTTI